QSDAEKVSDPNREAPPSGGDGEHGFGAGGVGGYNSFWVDPGSDVSELNLHCLPTGKWSAACDDTSGCAGYG
ncbi:hypothetical protein N9Y23_10320, partial [Pseudomonadales bacterium]|nr:hypothetical protein [Pseudomonadales bacterium]